MSGNDTLSSALVPLQQRPLLLPAVCIIEILDYSRPTEFNAAMDWLLGNIQWRSQKIPVVSFERLNQRQFAEFSATNRIMIIRRTTEECEVPYYGMVIQGLPQPHTLTKGEISTSQDSVGPAEKMQALFREIPVVIPNLGFVEKQLSAVVAHFSV